MDTKEFDSIVKAMMDGAQEEVSSGVWIGVQNGLAARKAAAARIVFFRRAGVAVAAIAAAVALLLWSGLFRSTNSIQPNIFDDAIAQVGDQPGRVELHDTVPQVIPSAEPVMAEPVAARERIVAQVSATEEAVTETEAIASPLEITATETTETEVLIAEVVETETSESEVKEESLPTLEEILQEEMAAELNGSKKGGKRVRLAFGGNIESNGVSTSTYNPPVRRRMSTPTKSTVKENGNTEYSLPISLGLGVKIPVFNNFSVGTGISYTELHRSFEGQYIHVTDPGSYDSIFSNIRNTIRYIGIPVNLYYDFPGAGKFAFYSFVGGMVEKGVTNKFYIEHAEKDMVFNDKIKGAQFSISFGLGVELKLTNHLGLYIDPSVKYYFEGNQPKSIRTQQPWMVNLEAGLRFSL